MRNKVCVQQLGHTNKLTLVKYVFQDTKLSFLSWPYSIMIKYCTGLRVQVLRKMF